MFEQTNKQTNKQTNFAFRASKIPFIVSDAGNSLKLPTIIGTVVQFQESITLKRKHKLGVLYSKFSLNFTSNMLAENSMKISIY